MKAFMVALFGKLTFQVHDPIDEVRRRNKQPTQISEQRVAREVCHVTSRKHELVRTVIRGRIANASC